MRDYIHAAASTVRREVTAGQVHNYCACLSTTIRDEAAAQTAAASAQNNLHVDRGSAPVNCVTVLLETSQDDRLQLHVLYARHLS